MNDKIKSIQVAARLQGIERPRIRIRFFPDRIAFHEMSEDGIGMSLAPLAVYRRDEWVYNDYLIKRAFK